MVVSSCGIAKGIPYLSEIHSRLDDRGNTRQSSTQPSAADDAGISKKCYSRRRVQPIEKRRVCNRCAANELRLPGP